MGSSYFHEITPVISAFLLFFLLLSPVIPAIDLKILRHANKTFGPNIESKKMRSIKATLKKINKPFVKSITSQDGDIIDCVLIALQPAFDNPMLKSTMTLEPPELPIVNPNGGLESEVTQLWSSNGESCPEGTIPIRRTTKEDILRSNSIPKFGKKISKKDSAYDGHEHAIGYVENGKFYGAQAALNVWAPNVTRVDDFSLSQIWVIADIPNQPLSTFEAGWQVAPNMYGNSLPRFFTYWTSDGYRNGCYNLRCSGFIQTTHKISLGATLTPISTYNNKQFDITVSIWKDPKHGNWWLKVGREIIGYWPVALFPNLKEHATSIQYGREVYSPQTKGPHTSTIMGSGHFSAEGFGKAAFVRNMEIVDQENMMRPVGDVSLFADKPNCYNVRKGSNRVWGNYIFFGGPGKNPNCP